MRVLGTMLFKLGYKRGTKHKILPLKASFESKKAAKGGAS